MKKKKSGVVNQRNRLPRIAVLLVILASLLGLFIAFQFGLFAENDPNPLLYIETVSPADRDYPFMVENNTIEFRNRNLDYCANAISGQILGIGGATLSQELSDDLQVYISRYEEVGDIRGRLFFYKDSHTDQITFSVALAGGTTYFLWLESLSTGQQLSQHVYIDMFGCEVQLATFNFIQVAEIP